MQTEQSRKRRRYSAALKAQIIAECAAPGVSVAKVALSHGINANIVHGWRKLARGAQPLATRQEFVPVSVAPTAVTAPSHGENYDARSIELELRRGAVTIKVLWPVTAAIELSAYTRELLR